MSLVIVTGASKGFGRAVALAYSSRFPGSDFVLLARDAAGLSTTRDLLLSAGARHVDVFPFDLSNVAGLGARLKDLLPPAAAGVTKAVLVNNAGSLGDLSRTLEEYDVDEMAAYVNFNVTSAAVLTTVFLRAYSAVPERLVVNISSLLAVQAHSHWGMYAVGKAARDMLHAAVAVEGKDKGIRTVNYAPGPLVGDMQQYIRGAIGDGKQREIYTSLHEQGQLVPMEKSAEKLIALIADNKFESGAHCDYYD